MACDSLSILLVEDNPGDMRLVRECLQSTPSIPVEIEHVETLAATRESLAHRTFDAVLLDLSLPDVHGLEALRAVRACAHLPIIVLTEADDDRLGFATLQEGAQDYLVKGACSGAHLLRSIRHAIERSRTVAALRRNAERYELALTATRDGIWDWDLATDTIAYSAHWKAMLGYVDAEVDGSPEFWFSRVHPGDRGHLQKRFEDHLEGRTPAFECEYRMRHRDGQLRWMLARGMAVADRSGERYRMVGSQSDITDRKQVEMRLQRAAHRDPLTGLDNRTQIRHGLEQALAASARRSTGIGVLFLDLDNFKTVNDTLGHTAGDHVLCVVARRLTVELRGYDRIARFGGDEFMILIDDLESVAQARQIARRVLDAILKPIRLGDHEATLSASIGITVCMTGETDPEYLLQAADVAMYHAKGNGKNGIAVFEPSMMNSLVERMELEQLLRRALESQWKQLEYQPIVALGTSRVVGIEALARLRDDDLGWIPPATFIPVAEASGLMIPLGQAVLRKALRDTRLLHDIRPDLTLSVNVSAMQLQHDGFVADLFDNLEEASFDPGCLTLEITETSVMGDTLAVIERLREIKRHGVAIAIDDFGTGHSSLSVLRELPIDILKVDRTFTKRMDTDADGLEIIRLITVMARAMRLSVIAEGIETAAQFEALQTLDCEFGQGFWISRPVGHRRIRPMLVEHTTSTATPEDGPAGARVQPGLQAR